MSRAENFKVVATGTHYEIHPAHGEFLRSYDPHKDITGNYYRFTTPQAAEAFLHVTTGCQVGCFQIAQLHLDTVR